MSVETHHSPHHHRSHHAAGRARQDRHLPGRARPRGARLLPGARTARLREVRRRPSRGGHAADHLAHLRRLPDRAPHGFHQGAGRRVSGGTDSRRARRSASWSTAPSWWKTTRCTSTSSADRISWSVPTAPRRRAQRARRDRQGRNRDRRRRSSPCGASCAA